MFDLARLRLLRELAHRGTMTAVGAALGQTSSAVSQQLAILRNRNIVEARKEGTTAFYRVLDPLLFELLDIGRAIFNNQLIGTRVMLRQLQRERRPR